MKIIYPNVVSAVQSTEADGSYPVSNLMDQYPKNTWKATSKDAVVTVSISQGGNSIALFNTNATSIDVAVIPFPDSVENMTTNGTFADWTTGDPDSWNEEANVTTTTDTGQSGSGNSVKLTATGAATKQFSQTITVVAEEWHRLNFYYKNTASDTMDYFVYDVTNAGYIEVETTLSNSTSWSDEQIVTFKTPASCVSIKIGFTPTNDTDIVWVDTVTLAAQSEINTYVLKGAITYFELITDTAQRWHQLWADFDNYVIGSHTVVLDMTALVTETLYCGVIEGGLGHAFNNPRKGLSEGLKDLSVVNEYKYGGVYINLRDIVRTFRGSFDASRDSDFLFFMHSLIKNIGPLPAAIHLVTGESETQWALYGRFSISPVGTYGVFSHSNVSLNIEEVV